MKAFFSILSLVSFADEINALKRYCEESLGITSFAGLKHLVVFFFITSLLCTAIRWVKHFGQGRLRLLKKIRMPNIWCLLYSWQLRKRHQFWCIPIWDSQTNIRRLLFCQNYSTAPNGFWVAATTEIASLKPSTILTF